MSPANNFGRPPRPNPLRLAKIEKYEKALEDISRLADKQENGLFNDTLEIATKAVDIAKEALK